MDNDFLLPIVYKGEEMELQAKFVPSTFVSRFEVTLNDVAITFERDDQGNYRAMNYNQDQEKSLDPTILAAIIESLEVISEK
jgi:hypothetical protein